jgi:nicotinamidase-related amidase
VVNGNSTPPHFKPENSALILIDYQVGTMQLVKNQMPDTALRNAVKLAKSAKALKMPIVLTSSQEDHSQGSTSAPLQHVIPEAYEHKSDHPA